MKGSATDYIIIFQQLYIRSTLHALCSSLRPIAPRLGHRMNGGIFLGKDHVSSSARSNRSNKKRSGCPPSAITKNLLSPAEPVQASNPLTPECRILPAHSFLARRVILACPWRQITDTLTLDSTDVRYSSSLFSRLRLFSTNVLVLTYLQYLYRFYSQMFVGVRRNCTNGKSSRRPSKPPMPFSRSIPNTGRLWQ